MYTVYSIHKVSPRRRDISLSQEEGHYLTLLIYRTQSPKGGQQPGDSCRPQCHVHHEKPIISYVYTTRLAREVAPYRAQSSPRYFSDALQAQPIAIFAMPWHAAIWRRRKFIEACPNDFYKLARNVYISITRHGEIAIVCDP